MSLLGRHQFHGAASRVAPDATAFALRRDHLLAAKRRYDPDGTFTAIAALTP
jgi:hypothetical protein